MALGKNDLTTRRLNDLLEKGKEGQEELYRLVHQELRNIAQGYMKQERADNLLHTTLLIDHAFLMLCGPEKQSFESRKHFFCTAARAMRQLLIDHVRFQNALIRGGGQEHAPLDAVAEIVAPALSLGVDLFALDMALTRLATLNRLQSEIFDLKYFAGQTRQQIADTLGITLAKVKRELDSGKEWLYDEIKRLLADEDFQKHVRASEAEAVRKDGVRDGQA